MLPPVRDELEGSTASTATPPPTPGQQGAETVDERRLPDAGNTGDADAQRACPNGWRQPGQQVAGGQPVVGAGRLDEGDGAGDDRAVAVDDGHVTSCVDVRCDIDGGPPAGLTRRCVHAPCEAVTQRVASSSSAASGIWVPGREDRGGAGGSCSSS